MVRSAIVIFLPCRIACLTSSSQTNSAGFSVAAATRCPVSAGADGGGDGGSGARDGVAVTTAAEPPDGAVYPREAKN